MQCEYQIETGHSWRARTRQCSKQATVEAVYAPYGTAQMTRYHIRLCAVHYKLFGPGVKDTPIPKGDMQS